MTNIANRDRLNETGSGGAVTQLPVAESLFGHILIALEASFLLIAYHISVSVLKLSDRPS